MSSLENSLLVDTDYNNSTTTTTTPSSLSNVSLFQTTQRGANRTFNIALLVGCLSAGLILVLVIIYALVKYRNRDEGSYKIDESKNFVANSHLDNGEAQAVEARSHRRINTGKSYCRQMSPTVLIAANGTCKLRKRL